MAVPENNHNNDSFELYTLFADAEYADYEIDRYSFEAELDGKERHYFGYSTHDILPYILTKRIKHGDNELKQMLGIEEVENFYNEGDRIENLITEDWVIEGKENIALGQSCCCKYKPLKGGMPYDIRQAFWFHGEFEKSSGYDGDKELQPPHTVSVKDSPDSIREDSFGNTKLEIVVRKLDSRRRDEVVTEPIPPSYRALF